MSWIGYHLEISPPSNHFMSSISQEKSNPFGPFMVTDSSFQPDVFLHRFPPIISVVFPKRCQDTSSPSQDMWQIIQARGPTCHAMQRSSFQGKKNWGIGGGTSEIWRLFFGEKNCVDGFGSGWDVLSETTQFCKRLISLSQWTLKKKFELYFPY